MGVRWSPAATCRALSCIFPQMGGAALLDKQTARKAETLDETKHFLAANADELPSVHEVLVRVAAALVEKGYRPVDQLVGFLVTGDPAYITNYGDARLWIKKRERDEILEEILRDYLSPEGEGKGR